MKEKIAEKIKKIDRDKIIDSVKQIDTDKILDKFKKNKNEITENDAEEKTDILNNESQVSTNDDLQEEINNSNKKNKKDKTITQEEVMNLLDVCYGKCLDGIPKVSESVDKLAEDYLKKYDTKEKACKAMLRNQIVKCTTSGFLTGFGGVITMPVTLPANVGSVMYVQMRMIACTAYMAGFELDSDQTQTFVYACLAGVAVGELIKQAGIKFGVKFAGGLIKKVPGKVITKINQKVGFRFITKFGSKGIVNLGKLIPGVGAVIGGGLDLAETKTIANRAYKWFFEGDFSDKNTKNSNDNVIEISNEEVAAVENINEILNEINTENLGE